MFFGLYLPLLKKSNFFFTNTGSVWGSCLRLVVRKPIRNISRYNKLPSSTQNINDSKLAALCAKQDRNAQKLLYQQFYGQMMSVCMRYASSKDEAGEMLNDGFMKVFAHIQEYKPEHSLQGWIRRIMVNNAIDAFRRNRQYAHQLDIEAAEEVNVSPDVIEHFAAEDIIRIIQDLPPVYKVVFNLYAIEGYSHKEIADQLQITESTSRANLAKARAKLQLIIKETEPTIYERYAK
ncbi:RNA polymerase sigma-70 factor, ECF subfamily [Flexibacter flexilis DSM 6793]|uniref:RNA polymerase sigma-70 factor, ECF subfamily n=1 Tax=Flexibacter flexilis DSM 6793 TaxID=927664 RepID=A0A1I1L128_9BACT|nr:RNA polymerase sigma-70 factor, ECF subfamily [Flexibacter flexilis DSM 6793]